MAKRKKNRSQGGGDYSGQSFVGADFSNTDLDGSDFSSCSLTGVDFSNADLNQSNFQSASITGCDFSNTNLCEADFQSASLTGCDFSNSDIDGATFDGVSMTGCDFSNVDIEQATGLEFLAEETEFVGQSFSSVNTSSISNVSDGAVIFGKQTQTAPAGASYSFGDQAGGAQRNVGSRASQGAFVSGGGVVSGGDVSIGNSIVGSRGSMSIRSVNGTSITDLGWVRITSEGGSTGVSSFGGLRSNNGQYLDTRVADIRIGNGILRMEVIGAGRIRCSIRDVNTHVTGEINELILEAGYNVDINGDFNMNIENRYKK